MARILLVDDEEALRMILGRQLQRGGHEVTTACDGEEASLLLTDPGFDVVVSDLKMPRLDGLGLLARAQDLQVDSEFVILTGHGSLESAVHAFKTGGVFDYLLKPLEDIHELNAVVDRAVERRSLKQENQRLVVDLQSRVRDLEIAKSQVTQAKERYQLLAENTSDVVWQLDSAGHYIYLSPSVRDLRGYTADELLGKPFSISLTPASSGMALARFQEALQTEPEQAPATPITLEFEQPIKGGGTVWTEVRASALRGADGQFLGALGSTRDITERKRSERALQASEERFRALVRNASDVIAILDRSAALQYVSPAIETVLGFTVDSIHGIVLPTLVAPQDLVRLQTLFDRACAGELANLTTEVSLRHRDGSWRACEVILNGKLSEPGIRGVVLTLRDITERKGLEAQLAHQAFHDALTGLPNRALFLERLERALARATRHLCPVAVAFLDLDGFKVVNDSLGHEIGDQLLVAVAERLSECVRLEDTVARLGGDEFTLLLEELPDAHEVQMVAERIQAQLARPIRLAGRDVFTSASMGIAVSGLSDCSPEGLLRDADTAMYQAKAEGKSRYVLFDEAMNTRAMARLDLEMDLRKAIANQEFRVYYQPIVELCSGRLLAVEALARWQHPDRGLVSPDHFIPVAEETGLILPLGLWVLGEACRQAQEWRQQYPTMVGLTVSVNVSCRQLLDESLVPAVVEVLQRTGLDPQYLELEITESVLMQDVPRTLAKLQELKTLGVRLAIDDFGTGYSSMAYLSALPVDTLKIDRSFVKRLGGAPDDDAIVRAMVDLAHSLRLAVTSEGIETQEQSVYLQSLGCTQGQGFHFARPFTREALDQLLAAQTTAAGATCP